MRCLFALTLASTLVFAEETVEIDRPVSIARDYLQPIGMPVVTTFHEIRESPFLNMHRKKAKGFEAIGDFFLAPSRYLFGGQDVDGDKFVPSFHYEELDWLKTTFAIIALPIGEIVGSFFKAAALLSRDTRRSYRAIRRTLGSKEIISNIPLYRKKGISDFHILETAACQGHLRPSVLPKIHQIEIASLKKVCKALDDAGIVYWLDCGTALGAYRYGGMIPWDDDIDLSILIDDHDNVKRTLKQLDPSEFQIQDWSSYRYPKTFLKLYLKKTKTLVDIYHYTLDEKAKTATYFYSYKDSALPDSWKKFEEVMTEPVPYSVLFPLKKITFDDIPTWVPNKIEAFLNLKYGENLDPTMIWDTVAHCYRKVEDHPYWKTAE